MIKIHPDFKLIFSQNPSTDVGRKKLPDSLLRKCICLDVNGYNVE